MINNNIIYYYYLLKNWNKLSFVYKLQAYSTIYQHQVYGLQNFGVQLTQWLIPFLMNHVWVVFHRVWSWWSWYDLINISVYSVSFLVDFNTRMKRTCRRLLFFIVAMNTRIVTLDTTFYHSSRECLQAIVIQSRVRRFGTCSL